MRLVTVVGARPQFIKAAVLSRLAAASSSIEEILVHTGQHYDDRMSQVFFDELDLPRPRYFLEVGSDTQAGQTGRALVKTEKVLLQEAPDAVLVYGDTNSTLAGALAAAKLQIPVAHVEAGLRSFDFSMPEEINRRMTDHISRWHFCPTETAVENLAREGITENVFQVGDVMYDALRYYIRRPASVTVQQLWEKVGSRYVLCTLHRAGNTDDIQRFVRLWEAINRLAEEVPVLFPVHPRTRKLCDSLSLTAQEQLHQIEPVGYCDMLHLEQQAALIVTDSGGVQKEAFLQRVPCLTLRDNTEWTETVECGWNRLVGADGDRLLQEARRFLQQGPPAEHLSFYGDGEAGSLILQKLAA